ncbi:MAG: hypothetical protein ABL876_00135 [Chitinophagaceae bacterium]
MAVSVGSQGIHTNVSGSWFSATTPKTATISWSTGDVIVVGGAMENAGQAFSTPTATGLTFTSRQSTTLTGFGNSKAQLWTAKAAASGSSVVLSLATASGTAMFGMYYWVLSGADDYVSGGLLSGTTNPTFAGATDGFVGWICSDWAAATVNPAPLAGTGTPTELVDTDNAGANYGIYVDQWLGTTNASTTYGITPYTSMQAQGCAIAVSASAGGGATPSLIVPSRRSIRSLIVR